MFILSSRASGPPLQPAGLSGQSAAHSKGNRTTAPYLIDGFMLKLEMALRKKKVGRPRKVKLQQVFKK